jgi:hypothetical protein
MGGRGGVLVCFRVCRMGYVAGLRNTQVHRVHAGARVYSAGAVQQGRHLIAFEILLMWSVRGAGCQQQCMQTTAV